MMRGANELDPLPLFCCLLSACLFARYTVESTAVLWAMNGGHKGGVSLDCKRYPWMILSIRAEMQLSLSARSKRKDYLVC
jgi:hypothetical protein